MYLRSTTNCLVSLAEPGNPYIIATLSATSVVLNMKITWEIADSNLPSILFPVSILQYELQEWCKMHKLPGKFLPVMLVFPPQKPSSHVQ